MYICRGKFSSLKELTGKNDQELFVLMRDNTHEYQKTISGEDVPTSVETFNTSVRRWFSSGRNYQFLVYDRHDYLVGTIFFYSWNRETSCIKYSCFFIPTVRKRLVIAESIGMSFVFAIDVIEVQGIAFDVYEGNYTMQNIAAKIDATYIGTKSSSTRVDRKVKTYLLTRSALERLIPKLLLRKDRTVLS